jgi:hypothetical protein
MAHGSKTFILKFYTNTVHTMGIIQQEKILPCPESKDTSRVGGLQKFLCLVWQYRHSPRSCTREPCSFGSGRTGFVWERCVWNGSTNLKSHQM